LNNTNKNVDLTQRGEIIWPS